MGGLQEMTKSLVDTIIYYIEMFIEKERNH